MFKEYDVDPKAQSGEESGETTMYQSYMLSNFGLTEAPEVGKVVGPPGRQPEQLPRVKIRVRAACGGQPLLHLPHRCAGEHCFAYHLPSSGFSGSTGVMAAMATSIMLSSGSKTVRCCTQMPGCRIMRVAMLSDRPHHLSSS